MIFLLSSIATAMPFAGLHQFPEGWRFKEWTGDDSKALMKAKSFATHRFHSNVNQMQVYLPAIEGHVPHEMVQALQAFLEFCYIACHNVHYTQSPAALSGALEHFLKFHVIFIECDI